jgi:hypothetical protein
MLRCMPDESCKPNGAKSSFENEIRDKNKLGLILCYHGEGIEGRSLGSVGPPSIDRLGNWVVASYFTLHGAKDVRTEQGSKSG